MKTWSTILRSAPLVGLIATATLLPHRADAKSPLDDVPASAYPILTITCTNWGNLTGADGDVGNTIWVASTDYGYLLFFDGTNASPSQIVHTPHTNLTGVAMLAGNAYAVSMRHYIFEGTVQDDRWYEQDVISLLDLPSDITDLDFSFGKYFVATYYDVRRVGADGSTTILTSGSGLGAIKYIEFEDGVYDNPMRQKAGHNTQQQFKNVNSLGDETGTTAYCDCSFNLEVVEGIAYLKGAGRRNYMTLLGNTVISFYDAEQSGLVFVPHIKALASAAGLPTLTLANETGNTVTLTWPTNFTGFNLQASPALRVAFTNLACSPVVAGTNWSVELSPTESSAFFRLSQ